MAAAGEELGSVKGGTPQVGGVEKCLGRGAAAGDRSWASLEVLPRGVSQAVPPQITVSPEHFAALLAAVGLDVCMCKVL